MLLKHNPPITGAPIFKVASTRDWTPERLERLGREELANLQANAERLGETELAASCGQLLMDRPKRESARNAVLPNKAQHKLVPRSSAFGARGVWLQDPRTSWSGIRKGDGMVVIALWRAAVQSINGRCACLLWSPNKDGARPWSDSAAGKERLEHCKLAMEHGVAEGLLVHGETLEGRLPEDRARTVLGIDPHIVIRFRVEIRGTEYWGTWGTGANRTLRR